MTPLDDPEQWPVYGSLISDACGRSRARVGARGGGVARPTPIPCASLRRRASGRGRRG